jgi:hypothetical protein
MEKPPAVALFVDIENIRISTELETAIVKMFPSAEILKIAVANFRLLSLDRELQQRGYHLFHVPSGSDNADREILNLSWLVKDYQKIVIVSNDKIFIKFIHEHNGTGKRVYIVHRSKSNFVITTSRPLLIEEGPPNGQENQLEFTNNPPNKNIQFTSPDQLIQALKSLVNNNRTINNPSKLAVEFQRKFGLKVSIAIKICKISTNFNQLVLNHNIIPTHDPKHQLITDLKELINQNPNLAQNPSLIGTKFRQMYGISISAKMKEVGLTGTPGKLLDQINNGIKAEHN